MGLLFYLLVVVLATAPYRCQGLLCAETYSKVKYWHESECYCNESMNTLSNIEEYKIYRKEKLSTSTTLTVNPQTGEGTVKFPLPKNRCTYSKFEIELRFAKTTDEESCQNFNPNQDSEYEEKSFLAHSSRELLTFNRTSNNSNLCPEIAEIQLFYIFTGCYFVVITPYTNTSRRQQIETKPQYVKSDIKKKDVELMGRNTTNVATHDNPSKGTLVPRFSLGLPATSQAKSGPMLLSLELRRLVTLGDKNACTRNSHEHDCCVMREGSQHGICTSDPTEEKEHCKVVDGSVQCTFFNVTPGNYCVLFQVQDDRCALSSQTVWSENKTSSETDCLWTHIFEVLPGGDTVNIVTVGIASKWHVWVILGAVVAGIFVCLMYGLFTLLTISRRNLPDDNAAGLRELVTDDNSQSPLMHSEQKLLLLYARDCGPFMDLMENLRSTLEKYCKCEVLDCYNEEYQKEIFTRENDWLLGHMNQSTDIKVVLVVTECAAAHQLAQSGARAAVEYRDPDPCDKFFPLALKLLKEDVNPGLYNRIKLVEFSGFKVENENPTLFPNPFTRFVLPTAFKELVCAIQQLRSPDQVNMCEDDLKGLHSLLDDLLQYKKDNPSYLHSIITSV